MKEPTMRRAGTVVVLLVVSAMLFAPAATAQVVGGSIGGIVTDAQASALPGVSLAYLRRQSRRRSLRPATDRTALSISYRAPPW